MKRATKVMQEWEFTFTLSGADVNDDAVADALFEATGGDIGLGTVDRIASASFFREAVSFQRAVLDAIQEIESAEVAVHVARIETDELVTLSEIAERTKRTPESIRLLVSGERGPGNFPAAASRQGARNRLWQWGEALSWFRTYDPDAVANYLASLPDPEFVRSLNAALELRQHLPNIENREARDEVYRLANISAAV